MAEKKKQWKAKAASRRPKRASRPGESPQSVKRRQLVNNRLLSLEIGILQVFQRLGMSSDNMVMMQEAEMFIRDAVLSSNEEEE